MQAQIKVVPRLTKKGPEIVLKVSLVPHGSGNRNKARQFAQALRQHPAIAEHVTKVVIGTSSFSVHLRSSTALAKKLAELTLQTEQTRDVPGQIPLFA